MLCNLSRTVTIAGLVEEAKKAPSKWVKEQGTAYRDFFWQGGYGAFSVSQSNVEQVREYVATQEEHHRKISFQDEFRALCRYSSSSSSSGSNRSTGISKQNGGTLSSPR